MHSFPNPPKYQKSYLVNLITCDNHLQSQAFSNHRTTQTDI